MASKLQIYNMALSASRGKGRLTSLTDRSRGREECDKWFDLVVDVVQEAAYWPCCKTVVALGGGEEVSNHDFLYKYSLPPLFLRPWYMQELERFALESDTGDETKLFTDANPARLYYAKRVIDTERWPAGMTQAVVYGLAYKTSESVTGKDALIERLLGLSNGYLKQAQALSVGYSTDGRLYDTEPDWISARGSAVRQGTRFYWPFGELWTGA